MGTEPGYNRDISPPPPLKHISDGAGRWSAVPDPLIHSQRAMRNAGTL